MDLLIRYILHLAVIYHETSIPQKSNQNQLVDLDLSATNLNKKFASSDEILNQEWKVYKETYNKHYDSVEEDLKRMQIFAESKSFVAHHNDLFKKGLLTYAVKINGFSDLTTDKLYNMHPCIKTENIDDDDENDVSSSFLPLDTPVVPDKKDWRNDGAVTRVKNQGKCGSCWAFSAVGALEGQYFRTRGSLEELSEQNIIDCSSKNCGCSGGLPRIAFKYIKQNGGIDTEKSYPYEGQDGRCRYKAKYAVEGLKGYKKIKNEEELKTYVGVYGPVSVLIDASGKGFHFYTHGVYFNATCSKDLSELNHAVLVVGYGVEKGVDYWLVKNSWGEDWGEKGYIKMARNRNNHCGISSEAVMPIFGKNVEYF